MSSTGYGNYDDARITVVSLKDHQTKTLIEHAGTYPRYLPGGHLIYVTRGTVFTIPFDLDRLQVQGRATLLEEVSSSRNLGDAQLDFSRNGTTVYRKGRREDLLTIQWLNDTGKTVPAGFDPGLYQFPRLSPDGDRPALMDNQGSSSDLWILNLERHSKARLTNGIVPAYPVWSPNGYGAPTGDT